MNAANPNSREDEEQDFADLATQLSTPLTEGAGTRIGPYKLLEQLGEGGFGVVWAAEQREPIKQRVALKIIKVGMETKQIVARFEAERQAVRDIDTGAERYYRLWHSGDVNAVAISTDGRWIATGGEDELVRVWAGVHRREVSGV